jgi:hypothetical protein
MRPATSQPAPRKGGGLLPLGDLLSSVGGLLGTLTNALSGAIGTVGNTVGPVTNALSPTLDSLVGSLLQVRDQAASGDPQAEQTYGRAVDMLRHAAQEGRDDAADLLDQLGETLYGDDQ